MPEGKRGKGDFFPADRRGALQNAETCHSEPVTDVTVVQIRLLFMGKRIATTSVRTGLAMTVHFAARPFSLLGKVDKKRRKTVREIGISYKNNFPALLTLANGAQIRYYIHSASSERGSGPALYFVSNLSHGRF